MQKAIFVDLFQLQPLLYHSNEILCRMRLDLDGLLEVAAVEKRTGKSKQIAIANAISNSEDPKKRVGRDCMSESRKNLRFRVLREFLALNLANLFHGTFMTTHVKLRVEPDAHAENFVRGNRHNYRCREKGESGLHSVCRLLFQHSNSPQAQCTTCGR